MQSKVTKVLKTTDQWTPPGKTEPLTVHLVRMENGDEGWTFSEKFVEGQVIDYDKLDSKKAISGKWYSFKLSPVKKEFQSFQKSPEQQQSIIRQHSQEMALRHYAILAQIGELKELGFSDVASMADMYEKDVSGQVGAENPVEAISDRKDEPTKDEIDLSGINF